jgi:hypothetical protein
MVGGDPTDDTCAGNGGSVGYAGNSLIRRGDLGHLRVPNFASAALASLAWQWLMKQPETG